MLRVANVVCNMLSRVELAFLPRRYRKPQAFSQKLYEAAARDSGAEGTSASGQGAADVDDDDIVDAEIVDDEKA